MEWGEQVLKAALYIRVSTEEQAMHGISLDAQKVALTEYAKKNNYEIIDYYEDEGISARKKLYRREAFQRLIADVENGKIDIILFTKLDRWFRNIADYYKIQEKLEKHNVNWKTIYENYDTSTAAGRLHINIMLSVAQDEADRTSERIKSVFKNKIANGEPVFGKMPYGYKLVDKKMVIVPDEAERVKYVFESYAKLKSKHATLRQYNVKYSENKSYDFISDMLSREFYIGKYRSNDNFCEPIVEKKLFDEVNSIKKKSFVRDNQTSRVYIFSGLIECEECGHKMNGITSDSRYKTASGELKIYNKYISYRCKYGTKSTALCIHNKSISEDDIEDMLIHNMDKLIKNQIETVSKKAKITDKRTYIQKIKSCKSRLSKLQELFLNDLIDIKNYKKEYERINNDLAEYEKLSSEAEPISLNAENLIGSDFKTIYKEFSRESKREFWSGVIDKITVNVDNKVNVIFK